jgi:hypothetical protein
MNKNMQLFYKLRAIPRRNRWIVEITLELLLAWQAVDQRLNAIVRWWLLKVGHND